MRTLISVVALFVLFGADVFGAIGSWPKTTTYTRQFLGATNADAARAALGIVATNSDVLTVTETNSTSVTNLVGRIVTSNNIVVGTIGTNLLSQSAYDALVGGGDGGSGDATLAGDNTWTGTNTFRNGLRINNGEEAWITDDGSYYGAGLVEVGGSIRTSTGFYGPLVTNDAGALLVNGVPFVNGGMDASNILTGTIDPARLPTTNSSWKFEAGSANTLVMQGGSVGVGIVPNPAYKLQVSGWLSTVNDGMVSASGGIRAGSRKPIYHDSYSNPWFSPNSGEMVWTDGSKSGTAIGGVHATNMLFAITNGLLFSPSGYLTTGAITVRSNSAASPPTLSPGDISFLSQDGVPMVVSKDASGVESTNRLDGVPAGIVTNNHAAAVTFSNDVTVASNLVVQGSSTFETLNAGELNVTNLAASIIDSTNIINGTISSNDIAAGTIGTNLLSQSAYNALVGGGGSGVTGITTNVAVLVPGDLTNTLQFYLGVLTNVVAGVVTNEEPESGDYTAYATKFGTTTDVLSKIGAFTDLADGTNGVLSFWLKWTGAVGDQRIIFYGSGGDMYVQKLDNEQIRIGFTDTSEVLSLGLVSTNAITTNEWHHVAATWDSFDASKCRMWIDAVECGSVPTRVATNLDYTLSTYFVSYDNATGVDGELCEFWLGFNQFIDLGESSNLQKFRSTGGKPADLGEDGSTPTGTSPTVYLRHPYTGFQTNSGTGGDFSVSGTLEEGTPP